MQVEQWVPMTSIPEVAGWYEISDHGRIRYAAGAPAVVLRRMGGVGSIKTTSIMGKGYEYVQLTYGGTNHPKRVHRLVAQHFVDNPCGYTEVNHIDGDRLNNRADNLEWCDHQQNCIHAFRVLGRKPHRWSEDERKRIGAKVSAYRQCKRITQ